VCTARAQCSHVIPLTVYVVTTVLTWGLLCSLPREGDRR
jgi:hypothetical protein